MHRLFRDAEMVTEAGTDEMVEAIEDLDRFATIGEFVGEFLVFEK